MDWLLDIVTKDSAPRDIGVITLNKLIGIAEHWLKVWFDFRQHGDGELQSPLHSSHFRDKVYYDYRICPVAYSCNAFYVPSPLSQHQDRAQQCAVMARQTEEQARTFSKAMDASPVVRLASASNLKRPISIWSTYFCVWETYLDRILFMKLHHPMILLPIIEVSLFKQLRTIVYTISA